MAHASVRGWVAVSIRADKGTGAEQGITAAACVGSPIITTHSYASLVCSTGRCESRSSTAAPAAAREAAPTAGATQRALPYPRVQAAATRQSAAAGLNAASAVASGDVGAADDLAELVNLSGLWAKDRDRSDASVCRRQG